jgi:hypothetical protein
MEITTRPPSRGHRRAGMALGSVALLLAVGLLVPAMLGLQQRPLADGTFAGPYERGALLFQETVHAPGELQGGDVITFTASAGPEAGSSVTRRVIAVDGALARTRGARRGTAWRVPLGGDEVERVVFAVPFAGHPQLLLPWLSWPLIAVLSGIGGAGALAMSARRGSRRQVPARPEPEPDGRLLRRPVPIEPATDRAASGV